MISLALRREGAEVVFDVRDAGPGIPPEDRDRIFDWFYQGEDVHHGRVRGSGLGLAIAREFVVAHGGRIEGGEGPPAGPHLPVPPPSGPPPPQPLSGQLRPPPARARQPETPISPPPPDPLRPC